MMVTDSFYYFVMLMAAAAVLWMTTRHQFGPEARCRRRRRKNHCRVVSTNKRPGITFLVRAR